MVGYASSNLNGGIVDLSPVEIAALMVALPDEEGRIVVFDPNDGSLEIISRVKGR